MNPSAPHPHRRRLTRAEVRRRRRSRAIRRVAGLTVMLCVAAGGVSFLLTRRAAIPSASAASAAPLPAQSAPQEAAASSVPENTAPSNALGLTADEAARLRQSYDPYLLYTRDPVLHRVLDQLKTGFRDGVSYEDLYQRLLYGADCPADQYLLLADFASYCAASHRVVDTYADREKWNRMSLHNIARSGIFSADRSIADYADTIWHVPYKK